MSRRNNEKPIVPHVNIGTIGHKDKPKEALEAAIKDKLNLYNKIKSKEDEKEER